MNANSEDAPKLRSFIDVCEASLSSVLSEALGTPWQVVRSPEEAPQSGQHDPVRLSFALARSLSGTLDFSVERTAALRIGAAFLGLPVEPAPQWDGETREAVEELFRQVAGRLATALSPHFGEVGLQFQTEQPLPADAVRVQLEARTADGSPIPVHLHLGPELMRAFTTTAEPPPAKLADTDGEDLRRENLDLLLDMELPATLRFGQRKMPLREILELNAGSIVELDRQVQEPVDLLLDDRIIARGEVVIVDGSYGLRVTEVASQAMRAGYLR
jgi:flagellar motor switch protein FliN